MKKINPLPEESSSKNIRHLHAAEKTAELLRSSIHGLHNQSTSQPIQRPDPHQDPEGYKQWYYNLTAEQKQAEWDKYYEQNEAQQTVHASTEHAVSKTYAQHHAVPAEIETPKTMTTGVHVQQSANVDIYDQPRTQKRTKRTINPFRSLITAGLLAVLISGIFYNEVVVAQVRQYISPSSTVSTPVIIDPSENIEIGPESRIIIPKINVDVPVVYDIDTLDENTIQEGLNRGVVDYNYPGTVDPGQIGNNVIVGHSSNNFLNSGEYKFAFVLLERLEIGDTFILQHEGVRYVYSITTRRVIEPTDFSAITEPTDKAITTLITCTPPGTSWKRFIIQAEQISPSAATAERVATPADQPEIVDVPVPGNAPSFWSQLFN